MTVLLVIVGLAVIALWVRFDRMERKLDMLEPRLDWLERSLRDRTGLGDPAGGGAEARSTAPGDATETRSETACGQTPGQAPPAPAPSAARAALIPARRDAGEALSAALPADPGSAGHATEDANEPDLGEERTTIRGIGIRFDFEDLFGRLLPIWAGGVALAVAGLFLVRYSIEQGLLGPGVRTALGFLFGIGLIVAAEVAFRQERRIADPRVRQALAGAGLATLYASFYMAGSLYGLIGPGLAFVGLAAVTAAAIALSFRFGLPSAVLGLVGGFAAPALVGSDEANLPLLALYLALVTGGLSFAGNRQGRSWLGLAALAGGLGWGALMLFAGVTGTTDIFALGGYIVLLGAVIPAFTKGPEAPPILRAIIAAIAALQMGAMVSFAGHDPMAWSLYLLLAAALAFFAWREPRLREASGFAALLALWVLGLWSDPPRGAFIAVVAGLTAVFALVPLAHVSRRGERWSDVAQLVVVPLGLAALTCAQMWFDLTEYGRAAIVAGFALIPLAASWKRWVLAGEGLTHVVLAPLAAGAAGVVAAGWMVVPEWAAPVPPALVAAAIVCLGFRREHAALSAFAWTGLVAAGMAMIGDTLVATEAQRLVEWHAARFDAQSLVRGLALLAVPLLLTLRPAVTPSRLLGEIAATIAVYGLAAQFLPGQALGWLMAAMAVALALLPQGRLPGAFSALAIALAWALEPLAHWAMHASLSLTGEAMLIPATIGWSDLALRLVPPMLAMAAIARMRMVDDAERGLPLQLAFGLLLLVAAHIAFKQLFAIATPDQFVSLGLAERSLWQALLLGVALALWKLSGPREDLRIASGLLAGAALAHFVLYSMLLHNPMLVAQAVGSWPVANLLLVSFGTALACLALIRRVAQIGGPLVPLLGDVASMMLIALSALMLLRQAFAGSILLDPPVGGTEDLLRSLLGILLAIGFLAWGAWRDSRTWRIGSLVLALIAVLKVFLLDAAGLEGLARIASFMALGFSLIGIGWFYTRQLSRPGEPLHEGDAPGVSPS